MYKQHNAGLDIVEKMWTKITVQPMSREELKEVICTKFSHPKSVVDKLLDIYLLLSAGGHETDELSETADLSSDVGKFLARDGRLISTR